MQIEWAQNPNKTKVILDDRDRKILKSNLLNEELLSHIASISYSSDPTLTPEKIRQKSIDIINKYDDLISDDKLQKFEEYLSLDHIGDCICIPCTCMRCYSESLLDITTIPDGMSKHILSTVLKAFKTVDSIDDAIEVIKNKESYSKTDAWHAYTDEQFAQFAKRWEQDDKDAIDLLIAYKKLHF